MQKYTIVDNRKTWLDDSYAAWFVRYGVIYTNRSEMDTYGVYSSDNIEDCINYVADCILGVR